MKQFALLYVTSQVPSMGFLMEKTQVSGIDTSVPPSFEIPENADPDVFIKKVLSTKFLLREPDFTMDVMGKRGQNVLNAKSGNATLSLAYRYAIEIKQGCQPSMNWQDTDGYAHNYAWSGNSPF